MPLEKRYDFLNLASGKKIQVPFDQLIVFSTNLEPKDLVDDAFLRRIPYKIEVIDPDEEAFRELFKIMAPKLGVEYDEAAVDYLIEKHYQAVNRPLRCCQPRDLLLQIRNFCRYVEQAGQDDAGELRLRGGELLRGDVTRRQASQSLTMSRRLRRMLSARRLDVAYPCDRSKPKLSGSCGSLCAIRRELLEQQARLDVAVVLVLAGVLVDLARDLVIEDLADRHAGIDSHRLHGEHLERPVAAEADVAEAGRHVHEQPQPADRRPALDLRHQVVRHGPLGRAAQVELVRAEHQPLVRNLDPPHAVGLGHVEHHLFVDHQLVVEREVVAVRVELRLVERIDDDVGAQSFANGLAGEDHGRDLGVRGQD